MYLPAFYKIKFEKYGFNVRRAAPFAIAPLIWRKHFVTQSFGRSGPKSTTPSTPTSSPQPEEYREDKSKNDYDYYIANQSYNRTKYI